MVSTEGDCTTVAISEPSTLKYDSFSWKVEDIVSKMCFERGSGRYSERAARWRGNMLIITIKTRWIVWLPQTTHISLSRAFGCMVYGELIFSQPRLLWIDVDRSHHDCDIASSTPASSSIKTCWKVSDFDSLGTFSWVFHFYSVNRLPYNDLQQHSAPLQTRRSVLQRKHAMNTRKSLFDRFGWEEPCCWGSSPEKPVWTEAEK